MKITRVFLALSSLALVGPSFGADAPVSPPSVRDMLREQLAEQAANGPKLPAQPPKLDLKVSGTKADAADQNPLLAPGARITDSDSTKKGQKGAEPATMLPKMDVRSGRITKLDQQIAKQNQDIRREREYTKPTELDKALNNPKLAKPLAIFGGESDAYRSQVSRERVSLMEDEKSLLEEIALAKTKQERAELQRQVDELRAYRRQLDQLH